jgi:hypothetical protein
MDSMGRRRAWSTTLVLPCAWLACSSSGSTSASPPSDAGTDVTAVADAAPDTASNDAPLDVAAPDGAAEAAADPCGPLATSWSRCAANPLARAGFQQPDGLYEVSIGDPDVQFDVTSQLWKIWWSTALMTTYGSSTSTLGIKYSYSADGVSWTTQPALTIESTDNATDWDATKTETPTVLHLPNNPADTQYLLFYSGANATMLMAGGNSIIDYQIGAATSSDGTAFTRIPASMSPYGQAGLVIEAKDMFPNLPTVTGGIVADPEIAFDGTTLHLFFSSLGMDGSGNILAYGISHATSTDGIHWTPANNPIANLGSGGAALDGSKGPSVVQNPSGGWEMFYQQDSSSDLIAVPSTFNPQLGIWKSTSSDLTTWTAEPASRELEWDGSLVTEEYGWIAVGDMWIHDGQYRYYYPAFSGLAPPSPTWVVPTQTGSEPSLIVLDMARHD